jgi:hypothetical protein
MKAINLKRIFENQKCILGAPEEGSRSLRTSTHLSKAGASATASANLAGRIMLLNTNTDAQTARKAFHCPGASGLKPLCMLAMYLQIDRYIDRRLDTALRKGRGW